MAGSVDKMDSIEAALNELSVAERAGVFRSTPGDSVLNAARPLSDRPNLRRLVALRWTAAAAVVLIAVTVWALMFRSQLHALRDRAGSMVSGTASKVQVASLTIADCLAGPSKAVLPACRAFDFNSDSLVDLRDFSAYQLAFDAAKQ